MKSHAYQQNLAAAINGEARKCTNKRGFSQERRWKMIEKLVRYMKRTI